MKTFRRKLGAMMTEFGIWPPSRIKRRVVAGMATMPSRAATFPAAFRSIVHQVDCLYLYLDGHDEVPEAARDDARVIPIFSRDQPRLGSAGKFLGLLREEGSCFYVGVDDDIAYSTRYVARLAAELEVHRSRAIVGVHGVRLKRPLRSYLRDRSILYFENALSHSQAVDVLGTGTIMFDSAIFKFDPRRWSQINMTDLQVAIEAERTRLPMICVTRAQGFLRALESEQPGSLFAALKQDDSRQTSMALELQAMRTRREPPAQGPVVEIFASHGIVDGFSQHRFEHRNLLDAERFSAFLRSAPKFVPLTEALHGRGRALTIDDATFASARAAMVARQHGHAVTLFVNPWQIESRQPYWFSRLDWLLDRVDMPKFSWGGREFDLTTFATKSEFRAFVKDEMRRQTAADQSTALIEKIEARIGIGGDEISDHLRPLSVEDVRALHRNGVDIENHFWTHLDPAAHGRTQFADEFDKAKTWIRSTLGMSSGFCASPFGEFLPHPDFLQQTDTVCLLLHNDLASGGVEDRIVNRITLHA